MPQASPAQDKLDALGTDAVLAMIEDGKTQDELVAELGIGKGVLNTWLHAKPDRSARVRLAMTASAESLADRGLRELRDAGSSMAEIARGRALEQHWRWRAAIRNPQYRERTDHTVTGQVQHTVAALSMSQLEQIASQALPMVEQVEDARLTHTEPGSAE
jgi:hypothetical protein